MWKPFLIVLAPLLVLFVALAQQDQAPPKSAPPADHKVPAEAARQVNPVKPTPESIANGKKMYGFDCAMCHGENGDGKGELAGDLKTKVPDLTDPATLKDVTDGEMFYFIKNGKGEMPPEGDRVKAPEVWNIVNYVRSLADKKEEPEKK
jgi:mono/diheme cytochrome c family protein